MPECISSPEEAEDREVALSRDLDRDLEDEFRREFLPSQVLWLRLGPPLSGSLYIAKSCPAALYPQLLDDCKHRVLF